METIYKYPLLTTGVQNIQMPKGAEVLTLQTQFGVPTIWAKVNPVNRMEDFAVFTLGTGHPLVEGMATKYLGTYHPVGMYLGLACFY